MGTARKFDTSHGTVAAKSDVLFVSCIQGLDLRDMYCVSGFINLTVAFY